MSFDCKPIHLNSRTILLLSKFQKEGSDTDLMYLMDNEEVDNYYYDIHKEAAIKLIDEIGDDACDLFYSELIMKCLDKISEGSSKGILNNKEVPYIKSVLNNIKNKYE